MRAREAVAWSIIGKPAMSYRFIGLAPEPFAPLWSLDADELARRNIRRVVADNDRGFPCRISLRNAAAGEELLLLPYLHHDVAGPYRASGPIFIRRDVEQAVLTRVPGEFRRRLLSMRAYDAQGWMHVAEVVEGTALEAVIAGCFARDDIAFLHLHNARPGCYACTVERA